MMPDSHPVLLDVRAARLRNRRSRFEPSGTVRHFTCSSSIKGAFPQSMRWTFGGCHEKGLRSPIWVKRLQPATADGQAELRLYKLSTRDNDAYDDQ